LTYFLEGAIGLAVFVDSPKLGYCTVVSA